MELKTLILGLLMSAAVFAFKAGGGLAYLFIKAGSSGGKAVFSITFMVAYGLVFLLAALVVKHVQLVQHMALLQLFFKSGMTIHFLMAFLLSIWGVSLLIKTQQGSQSTRAWISLVVPCPICFSVVLLICSFLHMIYPECPWIFVCFYVSFVLIGFMVASFFAYFVKEMISARIFIGTLMLYIAGYFMLSVIVIPQFADLERIYRISFAGTPSALSTEEQIVTFICLAAVVSGFAVRFNKPLKRD